jgi:hypothetical protein
MFPKNWLLIQFADAGRGSCGDLNRNKQVLSYCEPRGRLPSKESWPSLGRDFEKSVSWEDRRLRMRLMCACVVQTRLLAECISIAFLVTAHEEMSNGNLKLAEPRFSAMIGTSQSRLVP